MEPGKRFLLVDALRGIAAISVLVFHLQAGHHIDMILGVLPEWVVVVLQHGDLGVAIFFVLSGFVIAHSLHNRDVTLSVAGRFLLRRSLRLDPPYWAAIALTIGFVLLSAHFVAGKQPPFVSAPQILAHLVYQQDVLGFPAINTVFWTLCLELQFYCTYVLLLLAGRSYPAIVLVIASTISVAWPLGIVTNSVWPGLFPPLWHCFLLGALVYCAWRKPALLVFCSTLIVVVGAGGAYYRNWFSLTCSATALTLLIAALTGQIFTMFRWAWLQFLGAISYSLYLSHNFVTGASFRVGYLLTGETIATELLWSAITIAVCVSAAYSLWRWVELPSIALSHLVGLHHRTDRATVKDATAV
jgi:peptidoglycan/LPS O-acetylase OafA/YrhL